MRLSARPIDGSVVFDQLESLAVAFELRGPNGESWDFMPDGVTATTVIRGDALDLVRVAAQRADAADTSLAGEGPDVDAVLELVRTYA